MTRQELYELVWTTPMRKLAPEYGLSDVGLRKICVRYGIPTPSVGYWAKLEHGKSVRKTPLPAPPPDVPETVKLCLEARPGEPDAITTLRAEAKAQEDQEAQRIVLPDSGSRLHPVIAELKRQIKGSGKDKQGFYLSSKAYRPEFKLGTEGLDRGMRILDALARAAEARGHEVGRHKELLVFYINGEPLSFTLQESTAKSRHIPTKTELAEQKRHDRWSEPYFYADGSRRHVYPKWDYSPSGTLKLDLYDPNDGYFGRRELRWIERGSGRIEAKLNDIMATLVVEAEIARQKRLEREEKQRKAEEEAERRRIAAAKAERIRLVDHLFGEAVEVNIRLTNLEALRDRWTADQAAPQHLLTELDAAIERAHESISAEVVSQVLNEIPELPEPEPEKPYWAR